MAKYVRYSSNPATRLKSRVHNERTKQISSGFNALGIALIGAAFIIPVIRDEDLSVLLEWDTWGWIVAGLALCFSGVLLLGTLKSEE